MRNDVKPKVKRFVAPPSPAPDPLLVEKRGAICC